MKKQNIILACLFLAWKASPLLTLLRFACLLAVPLLSILASFFTKYILDFLVNREQLTSVVNSIYTLIALWIFLRVIMSICSKSQINIQKIHESAINVNLELMIMESSLKSDLVNFDDPKYYDNLQQTRQDLFVITGAIWNILAAVSSLISLCIVYSLLSQFHIIYATVMLLASIPSAIVSTKFTKLNYDFSVDRINSDRKKVYYLTLATSKEYAQDLRLYDVESYFKNRYLKLFHYVFGKEKKLAGKNILFTICASILPEVVIGIQCTFVVGKILQDIYTVGDFSLYISLVAQIVVLCGSTISAIARVYDNRLRISKIWELNGNHTMIKGGQNTLTRIESLEFKNVTFYYPNSTHKILEDVSFKLKKDDKVVLIGPNGSGKSTIIKLLLRFYEPVAGQIYINGKNINSFSLSSLRNAFSVYFQEMKNYSFSLRQNVMMSNMKNYNDESIISVLENSGAKDILAEADWCLDTYITRIHNEDGIELSVGQHQKLALARTFFRNRSSVFVFDEPTSSLDVIAKEKIRGFIEKISSGKILIFISHDLSTIKLANRIIMLEKGRVVADGSHETLIKCNTNYIDFFQLFE